MPKKKVQTTKTISNKRARFDYELGDSLVVGLVLSGAETKSLRMGHGHLRGAYITVHNDELYLFNATITGSSGVPISESDQLRSRKILAKSKEIEALLEAKKQGKSIIPLDILTKGRFIKLRIAAGKGKKLYDKRQVIKKREQDRVNRSIAR